jgi:hypothetical protein
MARGRPGPCCSRNSAACAALRARARGQLSTVPFRGARDAPAVPAGRRRRRRGPRLRVSGDRRPRALCAREQGRHERPRTLKLAALTQWQCPRAVGPGIGHAPASAKPSRAIEPRLRSRPSPGYHPPASVSGSLSLWRWLQVACGPQLEATSLGLRRRLPSLNSVEAVAIRSYHDLGSLPIPLAAKTTSPRTHSLTHSEKRDPPSGLHFDEATIGAQ